MINRSAPLSGAPTCWLLPLWLGHHTAVMACQHTTCTSAWRFNFRCHPWVVAAMGWTLAQAITLSASDTLKVSLLSAKP
jgi:hypothetical protein